MNEYCLITHPKLKNINTKYEKLLINDFLNYENSFTSFKVPERNSIHKMPLDEEMEYIADLKNEILLKLSKILNHEHGVNHSNRYWKIILGHYIEFIINVTYERWISIKKILETYNIKQAPSYEYLINNGFIEDVYDFGYIASSNDDFNHYLYSKAIKFQKGENFKSKINENPIDIYKCLNVHKTKFNKVQKNIIKENFFSRLLRFLLKDYEVQKKTIKLKLNILYTNYYLFFLKFFKKKIKFVLLVNSLSVEEKNSFYRRNGEPKLNFDYIRSSLKKKELVKYNKDWRKKILSNITNNQEKNYLRYLFESLITCLPKNYLENYKGIQKIFNGYKYSFEADKILISGARSEDSFNMWTANKIDSNKSELIICQQGGGPGSDKYNVWQKHDTEICDKYLSFGWKFKNTKKIDPVGVLNTEISVNDLGSSFKNRDSCLLIGYNLSKYSFLYEGSRPRSPINLDDLNSQMEIYQNLNANIKQKTIIRLKPYFDDQYSKFLWEKNFINANISNERNKFLNLMDKSKLLITTYNASTPLQSLFSNIPTIIFLDKRFYKVSNQIEYYYDKFKNLGVFFDNTTKAADQVNNVWDNPTEWWSSCEIQKLRKEFCNEFYKYPSSFWSTNL